MAPDCVRQAAGAGKKHGECNSWRAGCILIQGLHLELNKKLSTSLEQAGSLRRLIAVPLDLAGCWQERKGLERKAHSGGDDVNFMAESLFRREDLESKA